MDSMEVNKGIAAVLVAGIIFFLTGMIADNLVEQTPLEKSVLKIAGAPAAETNAAPAPAELPPIAPLLAKADVATGDKFVHTVCTACHSFNDGGKPIIGPNLYDVVGGPHDHEAGFNYSPALEKFKGQPWTFDALNHWLDNPAVYAPGTRMTFAGIPSAQQRADVIAYLRTLSPHPVPLPPPEAPKPAAAPAPATAAPAGAPGAAKAPGAATAPAGGAAATPAAAAPAGGATATPAAPASAGGATATPAAPASAGGATATPAAPASAGGAAATPAAPASAGGAAATPAAPAPAGGATATPATPAQAPPAASASPEPSPPAK
jgi:cytochrome c